MDLERELHSKEDILLTALENGEWRPELTIAMVRAFIHETGVDIEMQSHSYAPHIVEFIVHDNLHNSHACIGIEKEMTSSVIGAANLINSMTYMLKRSAGADEEVARN